MSAAGTEEIDIRLRQNVDTEGAKAAAGLKAMATGFDAAGSAGNKLAAMKMPAIVNEGSRLRAIAKDADAAAAGLLKMAAAQDASRSKREDSAMSAGLAALKASSREADGLRAHDDAAALASSNLKAAADEAAYQKAVALEKRRDKAIASISEARDKKAASASDKLPASLQPKAAKPEFSTYQKLLGEVESIFGQKAAGKVAGVGQGLAGLAEKYEKLGPIGQSLIKGGAAITAGALALGAVAAVALTIGAIKGAIAIGKISLEQSELKKSTVAALDRLSKGNGAAAYKIALKLSADLNLDEEDAVAQVKGLLQAKVDKSVIPLVVTAAADLKIAKGDEAAMALTKGIEKISNKGTFGTEALNSLAEAGVNAADVYAALAKKGESVASVMARVKTNQVGAAEGIKAVLAAVEKTSGGLAAASGQTIAGLANSIQKSFMHLFDDVDTGPLKEVLTTVKELFAGSKGDELKKQVTALGNAIFDAFKTLNTPEGKKALSEGFDKAAQAASDAAVVVRAFDRGLTMLGNNGGFSALGAAVDMLLGPLKMAADLVKVINGVTGGDSTGGAAPSPVASTFDTASANDNARAAGGDIAGGLAAGVTAGGPEIAAAVTQAANDAVTAAKVALGIASPSKVFAGVGKWGALGMAKGMNDNAGVVADAGASMAGASVGGAAGAMGSSAGTSSGSAPVQINITINPAAGTSAAQVGVMAAEATDAAHAAWLQSERRAKRDRGERSAA